MVLAAYTRRPTAEEKALLLEELGGPSVPGDRDGEPAQRRRYEDVYFALITSTEAVTNH
jgi:hypothetical protein